MTDRQLATTQGFNGFDQRREVFMNHVDDQLARQVAFGAGDVVLAEKGSHDFANVFVDTGLREEILAAQHPPTAHADQVNASTARIDEGSDHIDIAGAAFHALLVLDAAQQ
ncbi:hypothetical protein D3C86_1903800 [compost metagenome]